MIDGSVDTYSTTELQKTVKYIFHICSKLTQKSVQFKHTTSKI